MKSLILHNGVEMPPIGMGTFPLRGSSMDIAIDAALSCGYRAFDTAYGYCNDDSLGNSLQKYLGKYGLSRKDIFITTKIGDKLNNGSPSGNFFYNSYSCECKDIYAIVQMQINSAFHNLQIDYIDLLLIHFPYPNYYIEIWKCLEAIYKEGKVRCIGVSNFRERHLEQIINSCTIKPMVNQFEHHPLNTKKNLVEYCRKLNIQIEAYSPLMMMNSKLTNNVTLERLAAKYSKSIPQIILRWNIQLRIIPIPKSGNPLRLKENNNIFDFELTKDEVNSIYSLNENVALLPESIYCPGY